MDVTELDEQLLDLNPFRANELKRFPASHHSAPLTTVLQDNVVKLYSGDISVPRVRAYTKYVDILNNVSETSGTNLRITTDMTPILMWAFAITRNTSFTDIGDTNGLEHGLRYVIREVRGDLRSIGISHPSMRQLEDLLDVRYDQVEDVIRASAGGFFMLSCFMKLRTKRQLQHVQGGLYDVITLGVDEVRVIIMQDLLLFTGVGQSGVLINYDQLLMLTDTIACRALSVLTCALNDLVRRDLLPSLELLLKVYKWGDDVIGSCGQSAYSVIGEFESIVTAVFVNFQGGDLLSLGESFKTSVLEQAFETQLEHQVPAAYTAKLLELLHSVTCPNVLSEIFGLRKHWGNPIVDANASGAAVQMRADEVLPVSGPAIWNLLASFMRMIILEFIKKHGRWPDCFCITPDADVPMVRAWRRRLTRIPENVEGHQHFHWCLFRFKPNCVINDYRNQLDLISDKSISLYRQHLLGVYVRSLVNSTIDDPIDENRRMILEFLRKDHLDILDIMKIVMAGACPFEWLANSSCMKGTEMKYIKARIFAVLTYELRQYFAVTEDILKEHLFPYNPHQTMTMAEHQLLERLRSVTSQMETGGDTKNLHIMHIIDFSKWNLRMRYANTQLIFKAIDDFLGTPGLIESSHVLFEQMINIVQSPFEPPGDELEDSCSDTVWKFHTCGWEGQRQKGWTILTSALLSDIERVTGIHSTICGQGDNQTLLAKFPVPPGYRSSQDWVARNPVEVRSVIDQFYTTLEVECKKVGLKIKTAESCRSLRYFNYGKRLYYDGVELSMTLKRISKIITEPNDSFPTTENRLKTAEGATYASGLYSHPSILPYLMSRLISYVIIYSGYTMNPLIVQTSRIFSDLVIDPDVTMLVQRVMKIPQSLGGPPQQMLSAYLYRGHPDPLCTDLVMLILRCHAGCVTSKRILGLAMTGKWFDSSETHWESLITAPYSLNVIRPLSAGKPLEEQVRNAMSSCCQNTDILDIFNADLDDYESELISALCKVTPLNPLILNDAYSRSLPGRRLSFVSGLKNATSLSRLVSDSIVNPMMERVARLENDQIRRWIVMALDIQNFDPSTVADTPQHHVLAQQLREMSWRCPINGVTVPHPLEQFVILDTHYDLCEHSGYDCCDEHIVLQCHSQGLNSNRTNLTLPVQLVRSRHGSPYVGNSISEGIIQRYVQCLNSNNIWFDSLRLNTLKRWICNDGDNMSSFLESLVKSRTDVPMEIIDRATGFPSRLSYNHRASLMSTIKSCNISTCSNMHTRIYLSSNRMGQYSHGESNYHMPFGPAFLFGQALIVLLMTRDNGQELLSQSSKIYHMHVRSPNIPPVYDGNLVLPPDVTIPVTTIKSKLLFVDKESLFFKDMAGSMSLGIWQDHINAPLRDVKLCYASQLISGLFLKETIAREQLSLLREASSVQVYDNISAGDVNLIGVQSYINTIAFFMLLFGPTSIINAVSPASCLALCYDFLSSMSESFWKSITKPFLIPRLFTRLVKLAEPYNVHNSTSGLNGLTMILRLVVSRAMSRLLTEWRDSIGISARFPAGILCCPSVNILRFFWSKFVEVTILLVSQRRLNNGDTDGFQRALDFGYNIHSLDLDAFPVLKERIEGDFVALCRLWGLNHIISLPQIRFYNSLEPWIDRLRTEHDTIEEANNRASPGRILFHFRPQYRHFIEFNCQAQSPRIAFAECGCHALPPSNMIHLECLFTRTGQLSKSHLRFSEIIHGERFDIRGVVCLGTSTGTEAAYISSFQENQKVYVNCMRETSSMGEHIAGTFVPAAFNSDGDVSKLIHSSSAVLSPNDLLSNNTVNAILAHTRDEFFTGIICDAELPIESEFSSFSILVGNIIKISNMIPTVSWVMIKLPLMCVHKMQRICSIGSCIFSSIKMIQPNFSRPTSRNIIIAMSQRYTTTAVDPTSSIDRSFISLCCVSGVNQAMLQEFVEQDIGRDMRILTLCLPRGLSRLDGVLSKSITVACMKVIPGWFHLDIPQANLRKPAMIRELRALKNDLKNALVSLCRLSVRVSNELSMIRSQILTLNTLDAVPQVMGKLRTLAIVDLILSFIYRETISIDEIYNDLVLWAARPLSLEVQGQRIPLRLNRKRFLSITTRYILEVIGYVFDGSAHISDGFTFSKLIHTGYGRDEHTVLSLSWRLSVSPSRPLGHGDLRWCWNERSFLMSLLLFHHISQVQVYVDCTCPYSNIVYELRRCKPELSAGIHLSTPMNANFFWTNDVEVLQGLQPMSCVVTSVQNYPILNGHEHIVFRSPWSGIKPMRCCVYLTGPRVLPRQNNFVKTWDMVNAVFDEGLFGCNCADCSTESILQNVFGLTYNLINSLCVSARSTKTSIFEH